MIDFNFSKKLRDVDVVECSVRHEDGETYTSLGRQFGCDPETVSRAVKKYNEQYVSQVATFSGNMASVVDDNQYDDGWDDYEYDDGWDDHPEINSVPEEVLETVYSFVLTMESISVTKTVNDSEGFSINTLSEVIDKDNIKFQTIFDKIMTSRGSQETLAEVFSEMSIKERLEKLYKGQVLIDPARGTAVIQRDGKSPFTLPLKLSQRIAEAAKKGETMLDNLCNFAERLQHNPSYRAVNELYGFLNAMCIEIDKDGYVICFKKVRDNYMDIHSNTMLNAPGTEVRVERNQVDENSEITCSHGLHVCSSSYLSVFGFSSASDRVIRVKVDPADFVAIPKDYNNAKARTCGYFVMDDVTGRY